MIIDLHTQIWSHPEQLGREVADRMRREQAEHWGQHDASTAAHEEAMSCVDASIVLGFRAQRLGGDIPHEFIADFVSRDPKHRIGFAGIDPLASDMDADLDRAIALGLSGVAIAPAVQGFHPLHSAAMRLYERCAEASLPIYVMNDELLIASAQLEFARPIHWDEIARSNRSLRIIIGGMGWPWIDQTLALLGKHEHVFADLVRLNSRPWQLYQTLINANGLGVMNRILFGSGFPREVPAKVIEALYSVNAITQGTQFPSVPRAQVREIVERDSLALLGLPALGIARSEGAWGEPPSIETFVKAEAPKGETAAAQLSQNHVKRPGPPTPAKLGARETTP